jgi:uncharacterized protein DUF4340
VVAPSRVRRYAWPAAAMLAAGFIGALAFQGGRPEPGLARFEPAGVLTKLQPQQVVAVEVVVGGGHRAFRRNAIGNWRMDPAGDAVTADLAEQIETGLKLLHNSAPQRTDLASTELAEFGLQPPHLTVAVQAVEGTEGIIEFGSANPLGLGRYARVGGSRDIMLVPSFVAHAWEAVALAR